MEVEVGAVVVVVQLAVVGGWNGCEWREEVVGFRLVHDNQHNISRGGMWSCDQECSRGAYHFNNGWTDSHPALGFRLVWEGR